MLFTNSLAGLNPLSVLYIHIHQVGREKDNLLLQLLQGKGKMDKRASLFASLVL